MQRANLGELVLHVPSVSLREGSRAIRKKCQSTPSKELREFRRWALAGGKIGAATASETDVFLGAYVASVQAGMATLDARIDAIRTLAGVDVFALDDRMIDRAIGLRAEVATPKPIDEAILAAVLVKAGDLKASGATEPWFCDRDGDLVPFDRRGNPRKDLAAL